MKTRLLIAASVMAVAASFASPGVAQDEKFTINGIDVPANELEAVKMKCDELLAGNRATALAQPGTKTPAAEAPAAGASDDVAATESTAETPVDPAATAVAEVPKGGNMAADTKAPATDPATIPVIDLAALTADLCEAGGFTANPPAD
jgi:hypothetical protein